MKLNVLIFFVLVSQSFYCQTWHEKAQIFQIGLGDSYVFKNQINENRKMYTSKTTGGYGQIYIKSPPAIFLKIERALNKYIGVGLVFGYRKTDITQIISYTYYDSTIFYQSPFGVKYYQPMPANDIFTFKINDINIGARVNCHFLPDKKVDPYIGVAA